MLLKKVAVLGIAVLALQVWSVQADPLVSALSPAIPMSGEAAKYLKGIEIRNADGDLPDSETTVVSEESEGQVSHSNITTKRDPGSGSRVAPLIDAHLSTRD